MARLIGENGAVLLVEGVAQAIPVPAVPSPIPFPPSGEDPFATMARVMHADPNLSEAATFTSPGGTPVAVSVIEVGGTTDPAPRVSAGAVRLDVLSAAIAPEQGWSVIWRGRAYRVAEVDPLDPYTWRCTLSARRP